MEMVPTIENLSKYLTNGHFKCMKPWNNASCLAVICYVTGFCSDLEHRAITDIITSLEDLAREYYYHCRSPEKSRQISEIFVNLFIPKMHGFFVVPKLHQLSKVDSNLKPNEILAGFIHFLVQMLQCEMGAILDIKWSHYYTQKRLTDTESDRKQKYSFLQKKLMSLIAFLGDTPFQPSHHQLEEEVNILLAECEIIANEAGEFVYSCAFSISPVSASTFEERQCALIEKISDVTNTKIRQHCIRFSKLPMYVTSPSHVVDSFFIIHSLIEDLENMMSRGLAVEIEDEMRSLHYELTLSRTFLEVFDVPENIHTEKCNEPLMQLKDLAYEAEYVINFYVVGNVPAWYLNLRLSTIIKMIKPTCEKLHRIKEIDIAEDTRGCRGEVSTWEMTIPATTMDDSVYLDFQDHVEVRILADLIGNQKARRQFISIYGIAGLGKTTIAIKLYNSRAVCNYFDQRVWCVVSQNFNMIKLLVHILMSVVLEPNEEKIMQMGVAELSLGIHKSLIQRRYLIVLDDVWNSNVCSDLKKYFPDDKNGSIILLTSRVKDTAPDGSIFHTLPVMSQDQCWDLLRKKVFYKESCPPELDGIGKRIAARCYGIPLTVVVTAGILSNSRKQSEWEKVERQLDPLLDGQKGYKKILELSYDCLPHNIKPCFLYFAAFPEDAEVSVKKLMWLWIAEGFIRKGEAKSQEEIAQMYLLDLINRSLVSTTRRGDGGIKTIRIHDVLLDLCVRKANEQNFLKSTKDDFCIYDKHQRLYSSSTATVHWAHFGLCRRSLLGRTLPVSSSFLSSKMQFFRIMCFDFEDAYDRYCYMGDLPVNLRFLGINLLQKEIVCKLVNLEFLWVKAEGYHNSHRIPAAILKLLKLRHVIVKQKGRFEVDHDFDSSVTTNLRSVSYIIIRTQKDEEVLRCSPHLHELKCMCEDKLTFPDLSFFTELKSLTMIFEGRYTFKILPDFDLPSTITKLSLSGTELSWKRMSIMQRLPKLQVLKLKKNAFWGSKWETTDGEFPELRFLKVESHHLRDWIVWSEHFPRLECLELHHCKRLQKIPREIGDVPTLNTLMASHCCREACLSALGIEKEQHGNGNKELKVIIKNYKWSKEQLVEEMAEYRKK